MMKMRGVQDTMLFDVMVMYGMVLVEGLDDVVEVLLSFVWNVYAYEDE